MKTQLQPTFSCGLEMHMSDDKAQLMEESWPPYIRSINRYAALNMNIFSGCLTIHQTTKPTAGLYYVRIQYMRKPFLKLGCWTEELWHKLQNVPLSWQVWTNCYVMLTRLDQMLHHIKIVDKMLCYADKLGPNDVFSDESDQMIHFAHKFGSNSLLC